MSDIVRCRLEYAQTEIIEVEGDTARLGYEQGPLQAVTVTYRDGTEDFYGRIDPETGALRLRDLPLEIRSSIEHGDVAAAVASVREYGAEALNDDEED